MSKYFAKHETFIYKVLSSSVGKPVFEHKTATLDITACMNESKRMNTLTLMSTIGKIQNQFKMRSPFLY